MSRLSFGSSGGLPHYEPLQDPNAGRKVNQVTLQKRTVVIASLVLALILMSVGYALGVRTVHRGNIIRQNVVVHDTSSFNTAATDWTDVPGASATLNIPSAGTDQHFLATFSAESRCTASTDDPAQGAWCALRILVNGTEMSPAVGTNFAFDSGNWPDGSGEDLWEAHAIQRVIGPLGPGNHDVQVQVRLVPNGGAAIDSGSFSLDDWVLTVQGMTAGPVLGG